MEKALLGTPSRASARCQQCEEVCPTKALEMTTEYELAVIDKEAAVNTYERTPPPPKK